MNNLSAGYLRLTSSTGYTDRSHSNVSAKVLLWPASAVARHSGSNGQSNSKASRNAGHRATRTCPPPTSAERSWVSSTCPALGRIWNTGNSAPGGMTSIISPLLICMNAICHPPKPGATRDQASAKHRSDTENALPVQGFEKLAGTGATMMNPISRRVRNKRPASQDSDQKRPLRQHRDGKPGKRALSSPAALHRIRLPSTTNGTSHAFTPCCKPDGNHRC